MSAWYFPAVMSVIGGIQGYSAGQEMQELADEQERLAEQNALLERRELREQVRRQAAEDRRVRSAALARAAASGARIEGSVADYLTHMEEEQTRQLNWLQEAGASRIRLNLQAGERQADATRIRASTQMWTSLITGFTQGFGYLDRGGLFE